MKRMLLVLALLPMIVVADTEIVNGIEWTFTISEGNAIVGSEEVDWLPISAIPDSTVGAIEIPASLGGCPVTSIGYGAFEYCRELTSVTIPPTVTSIGESAFRNCKGLTSVIIPQTVTSIGGGAFFGCTGLADADGFVIVRGVLYGYGGTARSVVIPSGVTRIGELAFNECDGLISVAIPSDVTSIGGWAFSECSGLASLTIPSSVTHIEMHAFSGCTGLTSLTIPETVTSIGEGAFSGCTGLADADGFVIIRGVLYDYAGEETSVTIPEGVTSIGSGAFFACSGLTSVTIPEGVTSIGDSAFDGCRGLSSVTIPSSVISIGHNAFYICSGLQSITVDADNSTYASGDGILYNKAKTELILCPEGKSGEVRIPEGVTRICDDAFGDCSGLSSVTIPSSVSSIGDDAFCWCSGLTSVSIPPGAMSIGAWAFGDCSRLTSVTIPSSVTSIGDNAFFGCDSIQVVFVTDGPQDCVKSCFGDQMWYQKIGTPIQYEWKCLDDGWDVSYDTICGVRPAFGDIVIPSKLNGVQVTSIAKDAFAGCDGVTSVAIPLVVVSIGDDAFSGCHGLTSVTLPVRFGNVAGLFPDSKLESVTWLNDGSKATIPVEACKGLASLERVVIPSNVMNIGDRALYDCYCLKSVAFEGNAPDVGTEVFNGTPKDLVISVPANSMGWDGGFTSTALPSTWGGRAIAHVGESYDWSAGTSSSVAGVMTVSNIVVHYVLNSVQPQFAISPSQDMGFVNIITEVKSTGIAAIPMSWAMNYPNFVSKFGSDFTAALGKPTGKIGTGGAPMLVWQDYVAGTDPTNEKDVFTASITIVDGKVTISYTPELDDARKAMRKYTTWGKTSLMDTDWTEVQDGHEAEYNFFKVSVEMR